MLEALETDLEAKIMYAGFYMYFLRIDFFYVKLF